MLVWFIYGVSFVAAATFVYSLLSSRSVGYEMALARYRRKRAGMLLLITPILHGIIEVLKSRLGEDNDMFVKMRARLNIAGKYTIFSAEELVALQFLLAAAAVVVGAAVLALMRGFFASSLDIGSAAAFVLIAAVAAFLAPVMPLDNAAAVRRRAIAREWPFFLDLLVLALETGMDIAGSVERIIATVPMSPLMEELLRFLNEMKLGARRSDALEAMAARIDVPPITATIEMMVQAVELGTELAPLIRVQAYEFRDRQMQYVEKQAMEAPVKMLFPLLCCIFPAILIVLIGPIMIHYHLSK